MEQNPRRTHRGIVLLPILATLLGGCGGDGGGGSSAVANSPAAVSAADPVMSDSAAAYIGSCHQCGTLSVVATSAMLDEEDVPIRMLGSDTPVVARGVTTTISVAGVARSSSTRYLSLQARSAAIGAVEWIDVAGGRIGVLGQAVEGYGDWAGSEPAPTATPLAQGRQITELVVGQRVRVFGYDLENGVLLATGVRDAPAGAADRVTGTVTRVDGGTQRLAIGGLEVDFRAAAIEGFPGGEVRIGDRIEVVSKDAGAARPLGAARLVYRDDPIAFAAGTRVDAYAIAHWPAHSRSTALAAGTARLRLGNVLLQLDATCRSTFDPSIRRASLNAQATTDAGLLGRGDARSPCELRADSPSTSMIVTGTLDANPGATGTARILDIDLRFSPGTAWFTRDGQAGEPGSFGAGDVVSAGVWPAGSAAHGVVGYLGPADAAVRAPAKARLSAYMTSTANDRVLVLGRPILIDADTRAGFRDCSVAFDHKLVDTPAASFVTNAFSWARTRAISAEITLGADGAWHAVTIETYNNPYCD